MWPPYKQIFVHLSKKRFVHLSKKDLSNFQKKICPPFKKDLSTFLTEVPPGQQMTCEYEKDLSTFFFWRERVGAKARQENPIWHQPTSTFVWNKISPISPRLIFISGIPPLGLFFSWSSKFWKRWNKEVFIGNRLLATASDLQPANEAFSAILLYWLVKTPTLFTAKCLLNFRCYRSRVLTN